ncbi:MAG: HAD-IA family hydrolase [Candidatus Pacebacteria bacterium]|nr:HAD-IA family hydrolase [Candidatus Paceibacterota bacterium]
MGKNLVVIFDFDGTIADTMNSIGKIMDKLSGDFDFKKIKDANLQELKNKKTKEVFKSLGISLIKLPRVLGKVRRVLHEEIEEVKPIKGMEEVLPRLKKDNWQMGIITSCPSETVKKFLNKNNLNLFDFIYSEGNIFSKADKMNALLKERKLNPENVFYVGDETRDIEAAKSAGIKMIAVTWGFNNEEILKEQKPDYLIRKPEELISLLNGFLVK